MATVPFRTQQICSMGIDVDSIAVGDLNGDAKPDVVTANAEAFGNNDPPGTVSVLLNNTSSWTTPPQVTVSVTPNSLWPPDGRMVSVTVSGTVTNIHCSITDTTYAVTDEYGQVQPSGSVTLRTEGAYSFTVLLQASRLGSDIDGRHYMVTVEAKDSSGTGGSATSVVTVPRDQRH
jgi:FG-GAP repeat